MLHLLQAGPSSQDDLAVAARASAQTMSRTLDRFERDALVTRAADDADRRRSAVACTSAGPDAFNRARSLKSDVFPTDNDPAQLRRLLLQVLHPREEQSDHGAQISRR